MSGSTTQSFFGGSDPNLIKPGEIGRKAMVSDHMGRVDIDIEASSKKKNEVSTLDISEDFYSVQCEGMTTGVPSYFIRLKSCNLMCGGPDAELMKEGKATWWCDTEYIWRKGTEKPFEYLIDRWTEEGIIDWIIQGRVHLVWTGGEPTIPRHQTAICSFLDYFDRYAYEHKVSEPNIYNEIETNGTIPIEDGLFQEMDQINCSAKLGNSGMSKDRRIKPIAIERILEHRNYWFKFVISNESDLEEIENDFVKPFNISPKRVLMMPGLSKRKDFHERTEFVLETAKKFGYTGLSRLHISAWDQTTGV